MSKKYAKGGNAGKVLAVVLALVLVAGLSIGGTIAWLTASTTPVTNTFTTSGIDIELAETTTDFKMVPGYTIDKDPKVTVEGGSEKCYLFVKVEKSTNFDSFMTYEMAEGWTALDGVSGVFYRVVEARDADQPFSVLKNDQVSVKSSVTKEMMTAENFTKPTLTFTAYASQYMKNNTESFNAGEAWANITPNP